MAYCRYHNTLLALHECWQGWSDGSDLSESEQEAREELIELMRDIVYYIEDFELIEAHKGDG